ALFRFVDEDIANDPGGGGPGQTAAECLQSGRGDAAAQSRLLVALCRNRGIPARLVTGLTLGKRGEQKAHAWAEAWVGDYWLPMAALIICLFRNVIGINSFGTFAPALIGMAFRDLASLPGLLVFVSIVLIGWGIRRLLDRYHLLQVPRTAFLLSTVMVLLLSATLLANFTHLAVTRYFSLFPMVILTG